MKLVWDVPEEMIACQNTDGLQGLTQTHIITQDPMKLVFVQKCQPVHSILQKRAGRASESNSDSNHQQFMQSDFFVNYSY